KGQINLYSIHINLPFIFFILFALNTSGYLLMLLKLPHTSQSVVAGLQDIFITVVLFTITLGLWITGSVAYASGEISKASRQLSEFIMPQLVERMKALGNGMLDKFNYHPPEKIILTTDRKDELGIMIKNFSHLEIQIKNLFTHMEAAREQ